MSEVVYLRQKAQKCFRLARAINDTKAIAELEALGRELEERAAKLESKGDHRQ